jgi:hypothetical protein
MEYLFEVIKHIPWWVYVIFGYILSIGIKALKPQVISLKRVFLLPLIFVASSLFNFIKSSAILDISLWLLCGLSGFFLGLWMSRFSKIKADKKNALIAIEGSSLTLIVLLFVFSLKCFFGFLYGMQPYLQQNILIHSIELASSGVISGALSGRVFGLWQKYKKADHESLIV